MQVVTDKITGGANIAHHFALFHFLSYGYTEQCAYIPSLFRYKLFRFRLIYFRYRDLVAFRLGTGAYGIHFPHDIPQFVKLGVVQRGYQ